MTNMLEQSASWLAGVRKSHLSTAAVYRRQTSPVLVLAAQVHTYTPGASPVLVINEYLAPDLENLFAFIGGEYRSIESYVGDIGLQETNLVLESAFATAPEIGDPVEIKSWAALELSVQVTPGRTDVEIGGDEGFSVRGGCLDILLAAADIGAVFGIPHLGDRVTFGGKTFETLDLAGQGCWRWSDAGNLTLRLHLKEVI